MVEAVGTAIGSLLALALLVSPLVVVVLLVRRFRRMGDDVRSVPGAVAAPPEDRRLPRAVERIVATLRPRSRTPRRGHVLAVLAAAALVVLAFPSLEDDDDPSPSTGTENAGEDAAAGGFGPDSGAAGPWVTLQSPDGVSLSAPVGWRLDAQLAASFTAEYGGERSGMVALAAPDTQVLIWPLFVPGAATPPEPSVILDGYLTRLLPASGLSPSLSIDDRSATTSGRDGDRDLLAAIALAEPTPAGTAAILYVVWSDDLIAASETLAEVLASVRVQGAPVAEGTAGAIRFVRVSATDEPAFTVEVPSDWSYNATLERRSGTVYHPTVALQSPDRGTTILWSGVTGSPLFAQFAITGLPIHPEGATWGAIDGSTRIIRTPQPAEVLAQESLASVTEWIGCGAPEVTGTQPRPDLAEVVARGWTAWAARADYDAVELRFRCGDSEGVVRTVTEYVGYAMSDPTISTQPMLWGVKQHVAYVAPAGEEATAELLIARLYASFAYDTAWYSQQLGLQAGLSEIVTNAGREMSEIISRGYEGRQEVYDALSQRRSDATLGVERVEDSITGRTYEVESGSSYYWIDDRGTIVGTDVATAPNVDFRALLRG